MSALRRPKADMRELLRDRLHKKYVFCTKGSPPAELYVQSPVGRRGLRAGVIVQPATRSAGLFARGRKRDLPGSQAIRPVPMPRSPTPAEPTIPRHSHGI